MRLQKFHADSLEWALTNRSSLHNLVSSIEILYRARDMQEDDEIEYAEKTLWRAYELSKETLARQLVVE
jgi:hypothetical protein